jgi:hypothetical protein
MNACAWAIAAGIGSAGDGDAGAAPEVAVDLARLGRRLNLARRQHLHRLGHISAGHAFFAPCRDLLTHAFGEQKTRSSRRLLAVDDESLFVQLPCFFRTQARLFAPRHGCLP